MRKFSKTLKLDKPEKKVVAKRAPRKKNEEPIQNKPKEYELYVIWKSLPPMMINPSKGTVDEVMEKLGIDSPLLLELANIKTMTAFAEKYDVNRRTLWHWNTLIAKRDTLGDIRVWAKMLTKSVVLSMYNNAIMKGGTSFKDRENFLKVIEKWSDKLNLEHNVGDSLADILRSSLAKKKNDTGNTTRKPEPATVAK